MNLFLIRWYLAGSRTHASLATYLTESQIGDNVCRGDVTNHALYCFKTFVPTVHAGDTSAQTLLLFIGWCLERGPLYTNSNEKYLKGQLSTSIKHGRLVYGAPSWGVWALKMQSQVWMQTETVCHVYNNSLYGGYFQSWDDTY